MSQKQYMKKLLPKWWNWRLWASSSLDSRYTLIEACLIGFFSAVAALLLKQGIGWMGGWRLHLTDNYGAHLVLPVIGLVWGALAGWAIELLSPAAGGGGIPQVKAALARYPMALNLKVALVKTLGTILILGAGLTLGRRGPSVHIGAALGAQISNWIPNSPTNRRQTIAAGAAAGLAAGFNTPIAGVLFVIEELMRDISGLTLETAIAASFTGAVVSRLFGSADLNLPAVLSDASRRGNFATTEIPFYILLGIAAGFLGALFNRGIVQGMKLNRKLGISLPLRIGFAGLISGTIVSFLPEFFRDNAGLRDFLIAGELSWSTTAIVFVAHFCLTILAYSSGAPGGLFAPALVLGSALGYLVGTLEVFLIGSESPYTFALAGMGAFFTGVVRVPVTAIVIVFEMTADFNLVLPLMISCAIAFLVAESVFKGSIYQHLLKLSGIELTEETASRDFLTELTAKDVMQSRVETLVASLTIEETVKAMSRSHHRGFPVVEEGKLVGIVTQSDIPKDSQKTSPGVLRDIMTAQPVAVNPTTSLADVLYLLNRYQLSRLPVTEGNKLLGIITRSDIIKTEAQQLIGDRETIVRGEPSYITYQTRSPATGRGRILLPLANPQNIEALITIASAIATYQKYEIECLQVIPVPKYLYPSQVKVDTRGSRKLMRRLESWGRKRNIPVHTQIRIATNVDEAILETISQAKIDLLLMGWKGNTTNPEQIFGNVVDKLIKQATCDLMLVKLGKDPQAFPQQLTQGKWLIPYGGGGNIHKAMTILPALAKLYPATSSLQIELCQVSQPKKDRFRLEELSKVSESLRHKLHFPLKTLNIQSDSVATTIVNLAKVEEYSLIIVGASNEGLLQNIVQGNIPYTIAREVDTTTIVFRSAL
jgi:CIC family chloride channel protein